MFLLFPDLAQAVRLRVCSASIILIRPVRLQQIQPVQFLEFAVNAQPCAFVFGVDLAAAVPLSAARPVDERFCALRHGTDAAGLAEHTVAAHPAGLAEDARTLDLSEKQRVIRGEDRDRGIGRDSLCAVAAGQTDDGLRAAVAQGLEIALDEQHMAALVRQGRTDCLDPLLLQQLAHLLQLLFSAGLTGCGAAGAADQRDAAYTVQHRKNLLHGLFLVTIICFSLKNRKQSAPKEGALCS